MLILARGYLPFFFATKRALLQILAPEGTYLPKNFSSQEGTFTHVLVPIGHFFAYFRTQESTFEYFGTQNDTLLMLWLPRHTFVYVFVPKRAVFLHILLQMSLHPRGHFCLLRPPTGHDCIF